MTLEEYLDTIFCWKCGQGGSDNFTIIQEVPNPITTYVICLRCRRHWRAPKDVPTLSPGKLPTCPTKTSLSDQDGVS